MIDSAESNKRTIELMKNGYDPFLDFLKGFCILSVILTHCLDERRDYILFHYWGELAVPLFLILQAYHVFRKDKACISRHEIENMIRRIFLPFICVTIIEFLYFALATDITILGLIKRIILSGGSLGAGSYYFCVYLQFFILAPLTYWAFRRFNISLLSGGVIFTIICILTEFVLSYVNMSTNLYKLSCLRYIYLIYFGYVWSRSGIRLNVLTVSLSVVSIVFITIFRYSDITLEPVFFDAVYSWKDCHWICYFYPAFLFMFILWWIYDRFDARLKALVEKLGRYSWEIFVTQMFFFALFPKAQFLSSGNIFLTISIMSLLAFSFSILPFWVYDKYKTRKQK